MKRRACAKRLAPNQPDWREHYGALAIWEIYADNGQWRPLKGVADATRALTLSGTCGSQRPATRREAASRLPPTMECISFAAGWSAGLRLSAARYVCRIECRARRGMPSMAPQTSAAPGLRSSVSSSPNGRS